MAGFDAGRVSVSLGFDLDDRQLRVYDKQVEDARRKPDVRTQVKVDYDDRAYRSFMRDYATAKALPPAHFEIKVDVDQRGLTNAERGIRAIGDTSDDARLSVGAFSGGLGTMLTAATALSPVLLALSGAIAALAGSLASAVAGAGALGVGLGATFLPVAGLAAGAIERITKITKVYQAQQQATLADQTKAGKATATHTGQVNAMASALDSLKNAQMAVGDAHRQVTQAETDYDKAVVKARQDIQSARDTEVKAARDVTNAQRQLTQARVDAQRALEDTQRAAEDSSISEADAIRKRNELQAAGQTTGRDFFDAQQAVTQATTDANRAAQDNAAFLQQGVKAYEPLRAALQGLADATKNYQLREKELVALQSQGVHDAPGVVSAIDRIRQAREDLTRAVRAQNAAERGISGAQASAATGSFDTPQAKAGAMLAQLSPIDQQVLAVGKKIGDALEEAVKPGVDAIFKGVLDGLKRIPAAIDAVTPDLTRLGQAWGGILDGFLKQITGPAWMNAWHAFAQAAIPVSQDFGRGMTDVANVLRDIAVAVLPDLKSVLGDIADGMDTFAKKVHGAFEDGTLQTFIHSLVVSFRDWLGLVEAIGQLLASVLLAGKTQGDSMVVSLTKVVTKWREWIDANPAKVQQFFKDARQFLENAIKALGPFVEGWLKLAGALLKLAAGMPVGWLQAFGAAWLVLAGVSKFAGAIKVLTLMKDLVGKRLPSIPGGGAPSPTGSEEKSLGQKILNVVKSPISSAAAAAAATRGGIAVVAPGAAAVAGATAAQVAADKYLPHAPAPSSSDLAAGAVALAHVFSGGGGQTIDPQWQRNFDQFLQKVQALQGHLDELPKGKLEELAAEANAFADGASRMGKTDDQVAALQKFGRAAQNAANDVSGARGEIIDNWNKLQDDTHATLGDMRDVVAKNSKLIRQDLDTNTLAGAQALNQNFQAAVGWVRDNMTRAGKITAQGTQEIERLLRAHLADFGITGKQADSYLKGTAAGGQSAFHAGDPGATTKASGGWIGSPGERGGDYVHALLGRGEAVLNHYQQAAVNAALAYSGIAPGGLPELFGATSHTRHYMASGGFAADPGTNFSVGQEPSIVAALRKLGQYLRTTIEGISGYRTPQHSVEVGGFADDPHTRGQAADIGVPGGFLGRGNAEAVLRRFGLYRPFYPRDPHEINHVQLLGSGPAASAVRALSALRLPSLMRGSALDGLLSGAMRAGVRGANAVIGRVVPPAGPPTPGGTADQGQAGTPMANVPASLRPYNQAYPMHHTGTPGVQLSPGIVASIRQWAGLPLPDYISARESSNMPGIVEWPPEADGAQGYGLWQLTTGHVDPPVVSLINKLGGWGQMLNPLKNATASALLYRIGGPSRWATYAGGGFVGRAARGIAKFASGGFAGGKAIINDPGFAEQYSDILAGGSNTFRSLMAGAPTGSGYNAGGPSAYQSLAKDVDKLTSRFSLEERRFGEIDSPLVDENTGAVNQQAITDRVNQLEVMRTIREQIVAKYLAMVDLIRRIIAAYQEAIRRLQNVLPYMTKSGLPGVQSQIASYTDISGAWSDKLDEFNTDIIPNAQLDITDVDKQIAAIKNTTPTTGVALTSTVPTAEDIAAGALSQLASFQAARASLFGSFGSNFTRPGALLTSEAQQAAGTRFFGAVPGPGGPVQQAGGDTHVEQHNHITISSPNDTHVFTKAALFELQAAI